MCGGMESNDLRGGFMEKQNISFEEKRISYNELEGEGYVPDENVRYGVISTPSARWVNEGNVRGMQSAYINVCYAKRSLFPDVAFDRAASVRFPVTRAKLLPEGSSIDAPDMLYLVRFYVNGTIWDSKWEVMHPALDLTKPVTILRRFSTKICGALFVQEDGIVYRKIADADLEKKNEELDMLFAAADSMGFLRSARFTETYFCDLPQKYQEMALSCASRLVHGDDTRRISLGLLQRELIQQQSGSSFSTQWRKAEGGFAWELMESCAETSWLKYDLKKSTAQIVAMLNGVINSNSWKCTWPDLTQRFVLCGNELMPYFYVLWMAGSNSATERLELLESLCQTVKKQMKSPMYNMLAPEEKLMYFTELLQVFFRFFPEFVLPQKTLNLVLSVYLDANRFEQMEKMIPLLDPQKTSRMRELFAFYHHPENGLDLDIAALDQKVINLKLYQKTVALVWDRFRDEDVLPDYFLRLIAKICAFDRNNSMDEILRYRADSSFTGFHKQIQLFQAFDRICSLLSGEVEIYALASYVIYVCGKENSNLAPEFLAKVPVAEAFGEKHLEDAIRGISALTEQTAYGYSRLFAIFRYDENRFNRLQAAYADWYLANCVPENCTAEQYREKLQMLEKAQAFGAFLRLIAQYRAACPAQPLCDEQIGQTVDAYLKLQQFAQAAAFLQSCETLDEKQKALKLIQVLAENFRTRMRSDDAFALFGPEFTEEQAYEMLMQYLDVFPNHIGLVNSLIAICLHQGRQCQAVYLYALYQPVAEVGNTRFYTMLHRCIPADVLAKTRNYYDAIQRAFWELDADGLVEFFQWLGRVPVPGFKHLENAGHVFAYQFEQLKKAPQEKKNWSMFLAYLQKNTDRNLGTILACEAVLKKKFDVPFSADLPQVIGKLLANTAPQALPHNLLVCTLPYVMDTQDEDTAQALARVLEQLQTEKPLFMGREQQTAVLEDYQTFAFEQLRITGSGAYLALAEKLPLQLSSEQLRTLINRRFSSPRVVTQLCANYLQNRCIHETWEYLSGIDANQLNYQEKQLLELFVLLFDEDETMLLQAPQLFRTEEEVRRVKNDCIRALCAYPSHEGLMQFEEGSSSRVHKMLVYSYVFRALYDEEIYHKPEYDLNCLDVDDPRTAAVFVAYLRTDYLAQLYYNNNYESFYKTWRYLKLYLIAVLSSGEEQADDGWIIDTMEKYHSYESIYAASYVPFRDAVDSFLRAQHPADTVKRDFLFAMMSGEMMWFLQRHGDALRCLSPEEKAAARAIVERLDYRDVTWAVYTRYEDAIRQNELDPLLEMSGAFSAMMESALTALKAADFCTTRQKEKVFLAPAMQKTGAESMKAILQLDAKTFETYADCLTPLMFSRQLPFRIYSGFRTRLLNQRTHPSYTAVMLHKLELCAAYFARRGDHSVEAVYRYLKAFRFCLQADREQARLQLENMRIEAGLPREWAEEAQQMRRYALGQIEVFTPVAIEDSSQAVQSEKKNTFIPLLQDKLKIELETLEVEKAENLFTEFQDKTRPFDERLRAGVSLLVNYPSEDRLKKEKSGLPVLDQAAVQVGLYALQQEAGLSADEQLAIAADLFRNRSAVQSRQAEQSLQVRNEFVKLLGRDLSLASWVKYAEEIQQVVELAPDAGDFAQLKQKVLLPCAAWLADECSNETRYQEYGNVLDRLKVFHNPYTGSVEAAVRRERTKIENGIRLQIRIQEDADGQFVSTDGYVYYQIENIGHVTADLAQEKIELLFRQDALRERPAGAFGSSGTLTRLRPGVTTGGRLPLEASSSGKADVTLRLMEKKTGLVLSDTMQTIQRKEPEKQFSVGSGNTYAAQYAVEDADMLFGRKEVEQKLLNRLSHGLAVLYGPSRIGKTSLLNAVVQHAEKQGNVLAIVYGDELFGKKNDYTVKFAQGKKWEEAYSDNERVSEYLLAQTIVNALEVDTFRLNGTLETELSAQVCSILKQTNKPLLQRYKELDAALKDAGRELWLLLDEFQQVVELWKTLDDGCGFATTCSYLDAYFRRHGGRTSNIRLLLCGSDDLLRHMVLNDQSVWRGIFKESGVQVEPLAEEPFCAMMEQDYGIVGSQTYGIQPSGVRYSQKALAALFQYTGGVAIYGKEIGNVILAGIRDDQQARYANRDTIYVSDVAAAAQVLLDQQDSQLNSEERRGIREVYDAVTKGLTDMDMQYLWYIARWLNDNPESKAFPESRFTSRALVCGRTELQNSLKIACERRIIKKTKTEQEGENAYTFCTIFYYYAVLGTVGRLDERKIFRDEGEARQKALPGSTDEILDEFDKLNETMQSRVIGGMATTAKSSKVREALRELAGTNIETQNNTQNNLTIHVQTITNTLNGILTLDAGSVDYLAALQKLPRLGSYLGSAEEQKLLAQTLDGAEEMAPDAEPTVQLLEAEQSMEDAAARMAADYLSALAAQDDVSQTFCIWEQLGLRESIYDDLLRTLRPTYLADLILAAKLDHIFALSAGAQNENAAKLDYSPVIVMYCKVVEKMLKFYHSSIYEERVPGTYITTIEKDGGKRRICFGDLKDLENEATKQHVKKQITMGTFLYPMGTRPKDWAALAGDEPYLTSSWQKHGRVLGKVKNIRNHSAHGEENGNVDKQQLDELKTMLFGAEEELPNILRLAGKMR